MKNSDSRKWSLSLLATFLIPLGPSDRWKNYTFNDIKPNQVAFTEKAVTLTVDNSASPLLFNLPETLNTTSIRVSASLQGALRPIPQGSQQGEKKFDDFVLRVGLILKGDERLSWLQRRVAPNWLIEMENQLPAGVGIDKVLFYTTCRQKPLLNKKRSHFLSSKLEEKCVTLIDGPGDFEISVDLNVPEKVVGLWLASDGDDLKQKFQLQINKIEINYNKKSL